MGGGCRRHVRHPYWGDMAAARPVLYLAFLHSRDSKPGDDVRSSETQSIWYDTYFDANSVFTFFVRTSFVKGKKGNVGNIGNVDNYIETFISYQ